MRILQPAEWPKPRGFSHGVAVDGPGRWIVLAGQAGGDAKGEYQPGMAGQVGEWRETLGRNFPPSTLLYIEGLVDAHAKVEIEVTAFVPSA